MHWNAKETNIAKNPETKVEVSCKVPKCTRPEGKVELKKILLSGVASFFVARFCFAALFCFVSRVFGCWLFGASCFLSALWAILFFCGSFAWWLIGPFLLSSGSWGRFVFRAGFWDISEKTKGR